ncbi:hypothetical protein Trydic_g10696 [Trypoxylus dichotomus]
MEMYTVNFIPLNLRLEESIAQIAEALQYISDVANDIFKSINDKVEDGYRDLNAIIERINLANEKIERLSESKSATQVFSSSKYPASHVNRPYKSIFVGKDGPPRSRYAVCYRDIQGKDEPIEKLQFYHISYTSKEKVKSQGLGDAPPELTNTNDYLLYNTGRNPYSNYVLSNTLHMSRLPHKQSTSERHEIDPAPLSISDRAQPAKTTGAYFYNPHLGDVPVIELPTNLPNLPRVAFDLRYVHDCGEAIAPSVTTSLPGVDIDHMLGTDPEPEDLGIPRVVGFTPKLPKPALQTQMLMPTISEEEDQKTEETKSEPVVEPATNVEVPPPPKLEVREEPPVQNVDLHSSLMDAIRKAGGLRNANLRSTQTQEESPKKSAPQGDLMGDLHQALLLRRRGIRGAEKNASEPVSDLEKMSRLIPPPSKDDQSDSDTTDDEWQA